MKLLVYLGFLVLGILSLRGVRWAYISFVLLGLLYFPASVGFRLNPQPCELTPNLALAIYSLTNYAHIVREYMASARLGVSSQGCGFSRRSEEHTSELSH